MATATLKRTYEDAIDAAGPYFENEQPARLEPKRKKKKDLPTEPQLEKTSHQQVKVIPPPEDIAIQIVAASYDRVLHGITVTIPLRLLDPASNVTANGSQPDEVLFTDTFLLAPHTSSIRCLALSPPTENHKRFLATGSTDERINLFSLSTLRSSPTRKPLKPKPKSLTGNITSENPLNRPLGSLTHHTRPLTTLSFPTKTKLFSAAEDSTISITRTRDWNLLSTISAPRPAQTGRPSGDTAAPGEVPSGINDFAIHPSQKLMLSVGKGEKCLRLWNLMTGRKAGVLNFEREVLAEVGEGRHGKGEGRSVLWGREGEVFVVGFERGFVVFGVDCKVRAVVKVGTKLHRMRFLPSQDILAISTEDGRVVFYDLTPTTSEQSETADPSTAVPCVGELGGLAAGMTGRIKDFEVLSLPPSDQLPTPPLLLVTGNSDGTLRLWTLFPRELAQHTQDKGVETKPVGRLLATLETGNRITCLGGFVMDEGEVGGSGDGEAVDGGEEENMGAEEQDDESDSEEEGEDEEEFEGLDDA